MFGGLPAGTYAYTPEWLELQHGPSAPVFVVEAQAHTRVELQLAQ